MSYPFQVMNALKMVKSHFHTLNGHCLVLLWTCGIGSWSLHRWESLWRRKNTGFLSKPTYSPLFTTPDFLQLLSDKAIQHSTKWHILLRDPQSCISFAFWDFCTQVASSWMNYSFSGIITGHFTPAVGTKDLKHPHEVSKVLVHCLACLGSSWELNRYQLHVFLAACLVMRFVIPLATTHIGLTKQFVPQTRRHITDDIKDFWYRCLRYRLIPYSHYTWLSSSKPFEPCWTCWEGPESQVSIPLSDASNPNWPLLPIDRYDGLVRYVSWRNCSCISSEPSNCVAWYSPNGSFFRQHFSYFRI